MVSTSKWMKVIPALVIALSSMDLGAAHAQIVLTGRASIIDADTIEVRSQRIRLEGIDAPESQQQCLRRATYWRCGQQAANALDIWIGDRNVTCVGSRFDRYRRLLARCEVGGSDVGGWLARSGWAFAFLRYSNAYVASEEQARREKSGLWASDFVYPWIWRRCKSLHLNDSTCLTSFGAKSQLSLKLSGGITRLPLIRESEMKHSRGVISSYKSCKDARDHGATPIRRGQVGYSRKLDRDGDGIACE